MAETAVTLLLNKLASVSENEVSMVRGRGPEEIVYVRGELERISAFLKTADTLEESDEEVKVWVKQIRDLAHDTEDVLDEFTILQGHDHDHGGGITGLVRKMSCCIKNMKARYRVSVEMRNIYSRIKVVSNHLPRLRQKFLRAEAAEQGSSSGSTWQNHRGLVPSSDLVGIDQPKSHLVGWLIDGGSGREVVALTGMGGLGKSTLAKQVYDDKTVKKHFAVHAWITVSRSYKMEKLLKDIVTQIFTAQGMLVPPAVESMNSNMLKTKIKELLEPKRYLIVLDDVLHINAWDDLKVALPANGYSSRVMITTRNTDLAFSSRIESGKVYPLDPLPPEVSWALFCKKTFKGDPCPNHLKDICTNILRKCQGLPLAILAISGVLATKDKRRIDEWEMVRRSLGAELDGNVRLKNLKKFLSLSFNDLPYYLKSCFLYLSIFPEEHPIEYMRLIRLWVAEGFVEGKNGKELEDVGEEYLNELLNRSLLQVTETTSDGRVKACRIHDLLREIVISKSRDQNFAVIANEQLATWPDNIRRLSIHNMKQNILMKRCFLQLRSFFIFGVAGTSPINSLFPVSWRLLHVLDLQGAPIKKFPVQVIGLYYLKYLSLKHTKVEIIPPFIGGLLNLETLDLKHTLVTKLPVEILKLKHLRHLLVYRYEFESYAHFHSKYAFGAVEGIGSLQHLLKLCLIEAHEGHVNILAELWKLTQLRRLGIAKLRKEDGKNLCFCIENLSNLRALSLLAVEEDEILDLQHIFSPPQLLQRLYLTGRLEMLPHWIPNLESLTRVHLKWSRLKHDPLKSLQVLPNLIHLELLQVYEGDTLCFRAGGFKKLKLLGIDKFDDLTSIQIETGAMPRLEKLCIQRCKLLARVPLGIEHLTKLKVLQFFDMPQELIKTLRSDEVAGDYWRVHHIPEIYSAYWRDGAWEIYTLESFKDTNRPSPVINNEELRARWK